MAFLIVSLGERALPLNAWLLAYGALTIIFDQSLKTMSMYDMSTAQFHQQTWVEIVSNFLANWAYFLCHVQMLLGELVVNACVTSVAMKIILLSSDFAHSALIAVPLTLGRIIVIEKANVAEVQTERDLALLA